MKVKLLTDGCYNTPGIVGKIVEATEERSKYGTLYNVTTLELYKVDPEGCKSDYEVIPDYGFCFFAHEVEVLD